MEELIRALGVDFAGFLCRFSGESFTIFVQRPPQFLAKDFHTKISFEPTPKSQKYSINALKKASQLLKIKKCQFTKHFLNRLSNIKKDREKKQIKIRNSKNIYKKFS
jgi:hypothetical protein